MSNFLSNLENITDLSPIDFIQFGIMSPDEIKRGSVCEILNVNTFDGNEPVVNGLFDPRMGQLERGNVCATCEATYDICPGHFGHIELALPVYNIHFFDVTKKTLNCVCFRCSKILIDKTNFKNIKKINEMNPSKRLNYVYQLSSNVKQCKYNEGCNVLLPKLYSSQSSTTTSLSITANFEDEALISQSLSKKQQISPFLCSEIFKRISKEDCELLGFSNEFSRPEWMICFVLPVCPPAMRPSVINDNQRSEDDLTYFLPIIIQANERLKKHIELSQYVEEHFNMLQYSVIVYINNSKSGILTRAHRTRKPLKSIKERLDTKTGRIRGNLMGKRVDYSARTVITGDSNIKIGEFGVPIKMAKNLTFPEIVTKYNISEMYKLVKNGPTNYPGAKTIKKYKNDCFGNPSPCVIDLKYVELDKVVLNYGDVVNRHLINEDWILCNRQPSLHKMSMMAHKIVVLPGNTFRLNVTVTKPYNADFDGDELNIHIPQSYATSYELQNNASVSNNIIDPKSSKPIIGLVQDTVIGAYLLTIDDTKNISKKQMYNYLMKDKSFIGMLENEDDFYNGRELFSMITQNITLLKSNVYIKNGKLLDGVITSKIIGNSNGGLIHTIYNQYNKNKCSDFLNNCQDVITRWLETNSFSIGYGDAIVENEIYENIDKITQDFYEMENKLIDSMHNKTYHPNLDDDLRILLFENEMKKIAQDISDRTLEIVFKNVKENNNIYRAIKSGSKGKEINLVQVIGGVGQQSIDNDRVKFQFTDRTLPYFHKNDYSLNSRGFCKRSYIQGSNMIEFFYQAIAGRNGMTDTSLKTADTGYTQRKLIKLMEDMKIGYTNAVINETGNIIQFYYGDDSLEPINLEQCQLTIIEHDNNLMEKKYLINEIDEKKLSKPIKNEKEIYLKQYEEILKARDDLRYIYFKNIEKVSDCHFLSPLNLKRLIDLIISKYELEAKTIVSPKYITEAFNNIYKYVENIYSNQVLVFIKIQILQELSIKQCIIKYKFSKKVFDFLVVAIKNKILKAFVEPGNMVGAIAAQSIVEPLTQMTLNTFHLSGVAAGSVSTTQGVPRFNEIINYSDKQKIKTPSMNIFPKNKNMDIMYIKNEFEYIILQNLIVKTMIIYESTEMSSCDEEEFEYLNLYNEFKEIIGEKSYKNLSNWVLKIEFDINLLFDKKITIIQIQEIIKNSFESLNLIQSVISDDNNTSVIMRIKIVADDNNDNYYEFMKEFEEQLVEIKLRGVKNIHRISPAKQDIVKFNNQGIYEEINESFLKTDGTNFIEIINNELIDSYKTISNDISDIYDTFGIEAARNAIIYELEKVLGEEVSNRHICLLVDAMTYKGVIFSVRRHSIKKNDDYGPLAKASFEEPLDRLVNSAMTATKDMMTGVSANIAFGQTAKFGTNYFDILYDETYNKFKDNDNDNEPDSDDDNVTTKNNINDLYDKINKIHDVNDPEDEIDDNSFNFGYANFSEYNIGEFIPPMINYENSDNEEEKKENDVEEETDEENSDIGD